MIAQSKQEGTATAPVSAENFWISLVAQAAPFVVFCGGYLSHRTVGKPDPWMLLPLGIVWAINLWRIRRKEYRGTAWYYWPVQAAASLYVLGTFVFPGTILGAYGVRGAALAVMGVAVLLFYLKHRPQRAAIQA